MNRQIPLAKPDITQKEIDYVTEVMLSGVLSIGPKIEQFEKMIADLATTKYAIAVNSGTSALHLIVRALGIGDGDEVITTPFSFIASSNCILFERATPVFVDIDEKTLNMDIDQIEAKITSKTKAIIAVDAFGQPIDMVRLRQIADKHHLYLIEDAAEALGSSFDGHMAGSLADASMYAFYPNKQITTAEGGVILTNNDKIAQLCNSMRSQGRAVTGLWLHHERLGYNYRFSEINAALGIAQLERLDEIMQNRTAIADYYNERLKEIPWIRLPYVDANVTFMSWFVYVIRVDKAIRNDLMDYLLQKGIGCKPYFTPIHTQPYYVEQFGFKHGDYPVTDQAGEECLAIPFYTTMTTEDIDYIIACIEQFQFNSL
jgi:perosamine synthetase